MCVVSMITDHYKDKWTPLVSDNPFYPQVWPFGQYPQPPQQPFKPEDIQKLMTPPAPMVSAEEVAEFRRLLERAREYDKRNNEPECEMESKRSALKLVAAALGVDISFIDAKTT